jgi:flagellar basal body P-ring formation protein FlgA
VFEGTGIRLSVKAEAQSDAGVGQSVQVRNLQSNRKITATVQDADTVIVR